MSLPIEIYTRNGSDFLAPGDYVVMTAALRDISLEYPGRFSFHINCPAHTAAIFQGNPYASAGSPSKVARKVRADSRIRLGYEGRIHYLRGFLEDLGESLGAKAPLTDFRPDVRLSPGEEEPLVEGDYWVMAAGGKRDIPAKWWPSESWRAVAKGLGSRVQFVQIGSEGDHHPAVPGCLDLVGRTNLRQLIRIIAGAQGVVCPVTCVMHLAAAFSKPCVTVAGGRENPSWEAYTAENRLANMRDFRADWEPPADDRFMPHRYLHTLGRMDCCATKACWKSDIFGQSSGQCLKVNRPAGALPRAACMDLITPSDVIDAILSYNCSALRPISSRLARPERKFRVFLSGWPEKAAADLPVLVDRLSGCRVTAPSETRFQAGDPENWMDPEDMGPPGPDDVSVGLGAGTLPSVNWKEEILRVVKPGRQAGLVRRGPDGLYSTDGSFSATVGILPPSEPPADLGRTLERIGDGA